MDYAAAVAELFQAPHAEFVGERKRLAGLVRAAGNKLGAARLVAIQRPPISAWVVNQLYWHARAAFDEMFASASRLRAGDLSASQEHRESIARLRQRAATLLAGAGHGAAESTLRRASVTLSALAATGSFAPEQPGCLADDRDPPGFEAIAAMTAMTAMPPTMSAPPAPKVVEPAVDHDAALRSLDDDDDDDDDDEEADAAPVETEQERKYAAVQAMVDKQRAAAAAAAAVAAAAIAKRKAAAAAEADPDASEEPATTEDDDPAAAEQARKFAAAQAMVQKQRELHAKAQASVAAAIAARKGAAPAPLAVPPAVEMQRAAVAVDQAKQLAKLAELTRPKAAPPPEPSPPPPVTKIDQKQAAARERLSIEVKRARSDYRARAIAVDRLRTQLETAEIAMTTAEATLRAYEGKLLAIDPSYERYDAEADLDLDAQLQDE